MTEKSTTKQKEKWENITTPLDNQLEKFCIALNDFILEKDNNRLMKGTPDEMHDWLDYCIKSSDVVNEILPKFMDKLHMLFMYIFITNKLCEEETNE